MLRYHIDDVGYCVLALLVFVVAITFSAYKANSRLPDGDPEKQRYHPLAILFAPILFPFSISIGIAIFLLLMVLYAGFLVLFAVLLFAIRKPFLFELWNKFSTRVAEPLLKMSSHLFRMPLNREETNSQSM